MKGCPVQSATFERLTDAKKWAEDTQSAIRGGRHFKTSEAKRHTLAEAIDRYLHEVLSHKKTGGAQSIQFQWWREKIDDRVLADVTPSLIGEYREKLASEPIKPKSKNSPATKFRKSATVNRYLAALSHLFSVAVKEWGWLDDSPMRKVAKRKEPKGLVRFLSDEERERLLKACRESSNRLLYPVVVLALSTGMRLGEVMGLTWGDIDLNRGLAILHETKNGERRAVHLTGHALDQVKALFKVRRIDTDLLFPENAGAVGCDIRTRGYRRTDFGDAQLAERNSLPARKDHSQRAVRGSHRCGNSHVG